MSESRWAPHLPLPPASCHCKGASRAGEQACSEPLLPGSGAAPALVTADAWAASQQIGALTLSLKSIRKKLLGEHTKHTRFP